jgi:hypothetical protein
MLTSGCVGYTLMGWFVDRKLEERAGIYLSAYNNNDCAEERGNSGGSSKKLALSRKLTINGREMGLNRRVTQFW